MHYEQLVVSQIITNIKTNLCCKCYETSNSQNLQKQAKPKSKELFYVVLDRIGKKEPSCSHIGYTKYTKKYKMLTPVLFAAT